MRSYRYLITSLVLLLCLEAAAAARNPLHARQDENPSERPEAPSGSKTDSSFPSSSAIQSDEPSPTKTQSERLSRTPSDAAASATISVTATAAMQVPTTGTPDVSEPTSSAGMSPRCVRSVQSGSS